MSRATAKMRDLAKHLIAGEMRERKSAETKIPPAFVACEKLRSHLAMLFGKAGFQTLLSRAHALASAEVPGLRAVHFKPDGSWEGLDELEAQVDRNELAEGGVVLVAQLLGLLGTFIGEDLTLRLVREVWPELSLDDLDSGNEVENEKAK